MVSETEDKEEFEEKEEREKEEREKEEREKEERKETKEEKEDKGKTFTLKNKRTGTEKVVTQDELFELAQKSWGADENLRKASRGLKIENMFHKIFDGNQALGDKDLEDFADLIGIDADELRTAFNEELKNLKSSGSSGDEEGVEKTTREETKRQKITLDDFADDVRETFVQLKEDQVDSAQKKIHEMVVEGVDKDEIFGKIIEKTPEDDDARKNRREAIISMVNEAVGRRILATRYTGEAFGADMIKAAIQKVRADIKKYGIPSAAPRYPTSLLSGLGQPVDLPAEIYSEEDVKRVSSTDPGYTDSFVKRFGQRLVRTTRKTR